MLVFSVAVAWVLWPGCTYKDNSPKQGGSLQLACRMWSLACLKPFALPGCWEKVVAEAETHTRNSTNSLFVEDHVLGFVAVSWPLVR